MKAITTSEYVSLRHGIKTDHQVLFIGPDAEFLFSDQKFHHKSKDNCKEKGEGMQISNGKDILSLIYSTID